MIHPIIPVCMGIYSLLQPLISRLLFIVMMFNYRKLNIYFINLFSNVIASRTTLVVTKEIHHLTRPVFITLTHRLVLRPIIVTTIMIFINHLSNLPITTTSLRFESPRFPFLLFLARLA